MKVEFDEQMATPKRKTKKKRSSIHFFIFLLMLMLSALVALCLTIWFNVSEFKVLGNTAYSDQQIIDASQIKLFDNMLRINRKAVKSNIEQTLPYITDVKIKTDLFKGIVTYNVEVASEFAYLETAQGVFVTDKDLKVLKNNNLPDKKLVKIKGAEVSSVLVGHKVSFKNDFQLEAFNELVKNLTDSNVLGNEYYLTMIDVSDTLDLSIILNDTVYVKIGSLNNIVNKAVYLKTMLPSVNTEVESKINLSSWAEDNKKVPLIYEDIDELR